MGRAWRAVILVLLALVLGRFVVVGLPKVLANHVSSDGDESAYLSLGLALVESGTLSDGTRPPLYALLLSPWAERSWAYFTTAKLVTLAVGGLTLLALFVAGVRLFGWETALLATFLLAANKEFHVRATTVYADTLLALVMVGAWYYLVKSLEGWKNSLLAGIFVGLSFLTKGSAPVLLAAWGVMALLVLRRRIFRQTGLLLVPLFFVLTSLPLLIYNARVFGSPTYNFATQHIMWMDRLEQINTADPAELPTFSTYMASHTPADMLARLQKGQRRLNPVVAESLIPGREFEPPWLGPALGLVTLAVLAFLLRYRRPALKTYLARQQAPLVFTLFLAGLFYVFFTWYVAGSSAETRFIVPFIGPIYLVLADMVMSLVRGLGNELNPSPARGPGGRRLYRLALVIIIAWGAWWLVDTTRQEAWAAGIDPYESDRSANAEEETLIRWLADDRAGEALVLFGPSKSLPLWKFPARFTVERLPVDINTWPAMEAYLQARAPDYVIIDSDTARRRRQALADYFGYSEEDELVRLEQIPPGWALDLVYPGLPCRWCVFSPAPANPPLAALAGGIELLEYGTPDGFPSVSGEPLVIPARQKGLRVRLAWRAGAAIPADYTIFIHLTGPDGFVKAQQDRPPFGGLHPTSHWRPGEVLADRYDLALESIPPGEYLLLAGMYLPVSGQRLGVEQGPVGPAPGTILVGSVRVE